MLTIPHELDGVLFLRLEEYLFFKVLNHWRMSVAKKPKGGGGGSATPWESDGESIPRLPVEEFQAGRFILGLPCQWCFRLAQPVAELAVHALFLANVGVHLIAMGETLVGDTFAGTSRVESVGHRLGLLSKEW